MRLHHAVPRLMQVYALAFGLVLGQVGYWQLVRGPELATHPRNPRYWAGLASVPRGRILSREGVELALSVNPSAAAAGDVAPRVKPRYERRYPGGDLFAHVIGYSNWRVGEFGVERALHRELLGLDAPPPPVRDLLDLLQPRPPTARDVTLTIDADLQREAARALGSRKGAVAVVEVGSGAILALVDWPRFDPETVQDKWDELLADTARNPLLARSYQGRYPPGSVFKVVTAAAALQAGAVTPDTEFLCERVKQYSHSRVVCHSRGGHGRLTLTRAIAVSCNIALAETALRAGPAAFESALTAVGVDQRIGLFRPGNDDGGMVARGSFPHGAELTPQELAACGYGQGKLLVTPLEIASVGQMLGNGGVRLEPYLVEQIRAPDGAVVGTSERHATTVVSGGVAGTVVQMMRGVMGPGGTAAHLGIPGVAVAGKTGTAENPPRKAHSWFLALAPAGAPRVAVAVVVENAGFGSTVAGPVAMQVLRRALARTG